MHANVRALRGGVNVLEIRVRAYVRLRSNLVEPIDSEQ